MSSEIVPTNPSGECPCKYKKNGVGAFVRDQRAPAPVEVTALRPSGQAAESPAFMGATDSEVLRQADSLRDNPLSGTGASKGSSSWALALVVALAIAAALFFFMRRKG